MPESPRCPSAVVALAPFIDSVLAKQQEDAREQPECVLFQCILCKWLFFSKSVSEHLKPLQKNAAAGLPDSAHSSRWLLSPGPQPPFAELADFGEVCPACGQYWNGVQDVAHPMVA